MLPEPLIRLLLASTNGISGITMVYQQKSDPLDEVILDKPLREWIECWKLLYGGFKLKHPELRSQVGLARAVLHGHPMYVLRGTELKGGLEKGLQRIRGKPQTGNHAFGARMLKKHFDDLDLEVLLVGNDEEAVKATKRLKIAMIKHYDPEWNRPHAKRMKKIRSRKRSKLPKGRV